MGGVAQTEVLSGAAVRRRRARSLVDQAERAGCQAAAGAGNAGGGLVHNTARPLHGKNRIRLDGVGGEVDVDRSSGDDPGPQTRHSRIWRQKYKCTTIMEKYLPFQSINTIKMK